MVTSGTASNCTGFTLRNSSSDYFHRNVVAILSLDTVVALLTVILNFFFMLTIVRTPSLHTPANVIVCALFSCDLLVGIFGQSLYLSILFLFEEQEKSIAWLEITFETVFLLCSGFSCIVVSFVSIDRYFAICHPYKYRSSVTIQRCIAFVVAGSLIWSVFTITAMLLPKSFKTSHILFFILVLLVIVTVIFTYARIVRVIRRQRRTQPSIGSISHSNSSGKNMIRMEKRQSFIMAWIVGISLLLHLPYLGFTIYYLAWNVPLCSDTTLVMYLWDEFFLLLSSLINPVLYGLKRRDFRVAALRMIRFN